MVKMAPNQTQRQPPPALRARVRVTLRGAVQGVGFRPFVHRLAGELALTGWVGNSAQGVSLEVEGEPRLLREFLDRLPRERPAISSIQSLEATWLDAAGFDSFQIRASTVGGQKIALVLPDLATCPDCLRELFDPANRRHRYPFTNCSHCGPRYSIIETLPYDRRNTTMKKFSLCPACREEYDDPSDRRFHAQPNACPVCGPHLEFWAPNGRVCAAEADALAVAVAALRRGEIVAVKGIGGFHLLADARNGDAVRRLRARKQRDEKPFGLLFPTLESIRESCEVSPLEARLLKSTAAPMVLLARRASAAVVATEVAPGNPNLGAMLPSNPLHHLLLADLGFPVVATSGNLIDEPLCIDESEALSRLAGIADGFLVHNRPIVRHVDDSIVREVLGREMVLRRARGYAPLPVAIGGAGEPAGEDSGPVLAVGAHLKNAVALQIDSNVFISQHVGDLETPAADSAFESVIADLQCLYGARPTLVAADLHPDYLSTRFAQDSGFQVLGVQHHEAHVLACLAENEVELPALGVAWDGTGYGTDGTIWGGEFFTVTRDSVERVAALRSFRLPGGNAAVREPRRAALGMLFELSGGEMFTDLELRKLTTFSPSEWRLLETMLLRGLNSPRTSSVGRWFDAVAAVTGLRQRMHFEAQAAMDLEFAAAGFRTNAAYELPLLTRRGLCVLDWFGTMRAIVRESRQGVPAGEVSAKFHNTLARAVVAVARRFGHTRVALSGGCFQNRLLLERCVAELAAEKLKAYWHQRVPTNDGGIALGQVMAAVRARPRAVV
jgi:hydrogenase maturation protein HypF